MSRASGTPKRHNGSHIRRGSVPVTPVYLADASVRRILALAACACLRTATAEGPIGHNPTSVALPARDEQRRIAAGTDDLEEVDVRALTTEQLAALLVVVLVRLRLLVRMLAATGLRISEGLALRWGDLGPDGEHPVVRVRRACARAVRWAPKSRYGRRSIPIDFDLVRAFRLAQVESERWGARDLVFHSSRSIEGSVMAETPPDYSGVPGPASCVRGGGRALGSSTLRHTCASRLFASGRNAVQVHSGGWATIRRCSRSSGMSTCSTGISARPCHSRFWGVSRCQRKPTETDGISQQVEMAPRPVDRANPITASPAALTATPGRRARSRSPCGPRGCERARRTGRR